MGTAAIVPAAMFDIGNCVMVAAGTNVITQLLLHIQPGKTLSEQHAGDAPTLPYVKPKDRDAKRLARHAMVQPLSNANSFCAMLMVGMLMDLPASRRDVKEVLTVIGWRIPFAIAFAALAWLILPFSASIREAVAMCCLAPIAVFSTLFTDKVLGNAKLAGFSLTITAVLSLIMMTGAHFLFAAMGV